jgi:SAM-dependent methyltransferase
MRFLSPLPSEAELEEYNAHYFANAHAGDADSASARAFHSAVNRLRVEHVERMRRAENVSVTRVLEIGPGRGDFARHWMKLHPGTEYHVIESDDSCRASLHEAGVHIHHSLSDLGSEGAFDLLVMSHVLEHAADPSAFLAAMVRRLRDGALVFIEVPCRDDLHKAVEEPHLLFFDRAPMERLLLRCGVEPVKVSYHGIEITRLSAGWATKRSFVQRVTDRLRPAAERLHLLPVRGDLALVDSFEGRSAVRRFEAHVEKPVPAWWLRAVGVARRSA